MAKQISVKGVVQGVGFRPFVYGLATRLRLQGWVCSTPGGVEILIDGQDSQIEQFINLLTLEKPPLARIDSVQVKDMPCEPPLRFEILESQEAGDTDQLIPADVAICPDCERELFNPKDKRYLYPFINCKYCGPRFTILKEVPYDRPNTTMADFPMCADCRAEYVDPLDRHFQAHPVACPECGPFVELRETHSQFPTSSPRIASIEIRVSAILKARRLLREGYIVAIKGLGGFHLACDAANPYTLAELRDRKGRSDKPFAVMTADLTVAASICHIQKEEQVLLTSREKPIVLLSKRKQNGSLNYKVSELVAPNLDSLGVMLPYTPLHHLLLNQTDPVLAREPAPPILVMTSSNFSEEPIAIDNKDALEKLSPLADAFLLHNRDIHIRLDDSVVRVDHGPWITVHEHKDTVPPRSSVVYLRRARGYAPYALQLPVDVKPSLAVGGELKNTFCLTRARYAFLSHHIGDMENTETFASFGQGVNHLSHVFRVQPEIVAHDLHPGYFTTQYAERSSVPRVAVQHHHAHIAACMADNGLTDRRVIGLAFDGTGYGSDEAIWGGEVLLASYGNFERFAHLEYLPLPGGGAAIHSPWRVMAGYAHALGIEVDNLPFLQNIDKEALRLLRQQIDQKHEALFTSSLGRLFDAVASLIGVRNEVTYEAQAAMELEALSRELVPGAQPYPYDIEDVRYPERSKASLPPSDIEFVIRLKPLLSAIVQDLHANEATGRIGARFHKTVAEIAVEVCKLARTSTGLKEVALSGGVWQNQTLLALARSGLKQEGFVVYFHRQVPTNDGGLALGQAMVANFVRAEQTLRETRQKPEAER